MGTDVYTLRKDTLHLIDLDGQQVVTHLYSYAFKSPIQNKSMAILQAQKAWKTYSSGLVVVADAESLEGAYIYTQVTNCVWANCNDFPGSAYGIVQIDEGSLRIVLATPWTRLRCTNQESRMHVKSHKFKNECRRIHNNRPVSTVRGEPVCAESGEPVCAESGEKIFRHDAA